MSEEFLKNWCGQNTAMNVQQLVTSSSSSSSSSSNSGLSYSVQDAESMIILNLRQRVYLNAVIPRHMRLVSESAHMAKTAIKSTSSNSLSVSSVKLFPAAERKGRIPPEKVRESEES